MKKKSNVKLLFFETLLKGNNGKIFALIYEKLKHTDQYLHYNSPYNFQLCRKCCFILSLTGHTPSLSIKIN